MPERRAFPRWPVTLDCQGSRKGQSFRSRIYQLSENGLGFDSGGLADIGEELSVAWSLEPGDPALQVQCAVRESSPARTGVEFLNLTLGDRLRIVRFLSERETETS